MLSKENRYIQVKVSKLVYLYLKKYSKLFDISISRFCEMAIQEKIIKNGVDFEKINVSVSSANCN